MLRREGMETILESIRRLSGRHGLLIDSYSPDKTRLYKLVEVTDNQTGGEKDISPRYKNKEFSIFLKGMITALELTKTGGKR